VPLRVVYGERDRILPDISETVARLAADVPHAEITALPHCGHFLQEEAPGEVGELLAPFFAAGRSVGAACIIRG
jgi:haloalkane dehalogenase